MNNGTRLCQFPATGLDVASLVLEATPEDDTPARLMIFGTRGAGTVRIEDLAAMEAAIESESPDDETVARLTHSLARAAVSAHIENLTWHNDVLAAGSVLSVTSVAADNNDPPIESVFSDSAEGEARRRELQQAFAELDAGTHASRSIPVPLPWKTLSFRVAVNGEILCVATVTEERPLLTLNVVWDQWRPETFWLTVGSSPQGWPPKPNEGHEWIDQRIGVEQRLEVTIVA
jgi:hypothetical protein